MLREQSIKTHTKFVQDVRYAASGDHFASVGSDAKIFVYDGKTGDTLGEFTENGHKGSIVRLSLLLLPVCIAHNWLSDGMYLEPR